MCLGSYLNLKEDLGQVMDSESQVFHPLASLEQSRFQNEEGKEFPVDGARKQGSGRTPRHHTTAVSELMNKYQRWNGLEGLCGSLLQAPSKKSHPRAVAGSCVALGGSPHFSEQSPP